MNTFRNDIPQQRRSNYANGNSQVYTNGATGNHGNGNGLCLFESAKSSPMIEADHTLKNGTGIGKLNTFNQATTPSSDTECDPSLAWKNDGKAYNQGPDQILPSSALYTWNRDGATRICSSGDIEIVKRAPLSVPTLLHNAVKRSPDRTALAVKRDGEWQKWTYEQYLKDVRTAAKGFICLGLEKYHSVCILGSNSPEWVISDLAAIYAGGFATGVYATNSPKVCAFVARDSNANIVVVEDDEQLEKVLQIKDSLPHLKAIIQYSGEPKEAGVYSWAELMALGLEQDDNTLEERLKHISINQCCTLIYTSGTTGNPKGVMLSHDHLTWTAHVNSKVCEFRDASEEYISFLPLNHVAAQITDIYCALTCSASIYFGDKNALKGTLIDTMREIKPTFFFAVPRVWEKMYERMQEIGKETKGLKKIIGTWAKAQALENNLERMNGSENQGTLGFNIANRLILSKVRDALGLTRCHQHLSGGAPINIEVLKYFMSLNILIMEIYGMSECTGPHSVSTESAFRLGSVGRPTDGVDTKLCKRDDAGDGEICMAGRHVQMGYLNQPEMTRVAIDEDGWLHSGDIGKLDDDGYLFITGRIKELLITSGGENIPPVPIEDNVKSALPILSQAMVICEKLKFVSILLTLKTDVDIDTQQPLDSLLPSARNWINENGDCNVATVSEVLKEIYEKRNGKLISAFQAGIDEANKKAVSRAQFVQKWRILPVDFSIPGGELTPTLKLKRKAAQDKYQQLIDDLYSTQ